MWNIIKQIKLNLLISQAIGSESIPPIEFYEFKLLIILVLANKYLIILVLANKYLSMLLDLKTDNKELLMVENIIFFSLKTINSLIGTWHIPELLRVFSTSCINFGICCLDCSFDK